MSQSSESPSSAATGGEIMLFGVRVRVDPMRKSVSMNNLSEYEPVVNNGNEIPKDAADAGYASADEAVPHPSAGNRERKRGIPWTEEEHKLFLVGLQKVGKGDWRGISRNYVKTRTPTQVASHAQKYFLRRSNINRRRRRSSLFDITTDSVTAMPIEEAAKNHHQESPLPPPTTVPLPITSNGSNGFSVVPFPVTVSPVMFTMQSGNTAIAQTEVAKNSSPTMLVCPVPCSSTMVDLNLRQHVVVEPSPLSLRLSLSSGQDQPAASAFQMMQGFKNGDSSISVA
ncbi:transcription factor MYB1R1 [Salvia miltiorrhiza]|uniref:transcription factor MYB1R1 n=1 Tax=Salvia miltiorrhiza TaxID=226208 RepID=UPI0025AD7CC3|nr:transcription factor MYB1R1 [Salvia miltiorrhiza]